MDAEYRKLVEEIDGIGDVDSLDEGELRADARRTLLLLAPQAIDQLLHIAQYADDDRTRFQAAKCLIDMALDAGTSSANGWEKAMGALQARANTRGK